MSKKHTVSVLFFEDFEFTVDVYIAKAEPDVGIMNDYIDEWYITKADNCKDKDVVEFFQQKIEKDKYLSGQWDDAMREALSENDEPDPDYYKDLRQDR